MKDGTVMLAASVSLGALLLLGAGVGGYLLLKPRLSNPGTTSAAAPGTPPAGVPSLPIGNGVVAPIGPSAADIFAAQEAERKRQEEWRRADKIRELDQALAEVQNEIKRLTDQLNSIDAAPMSQEHIQAWSAKHMQSCYDAYVFGFGCNKRNDLSEGWDLKARADWDQRMATQKRPILTRLSELNTKQQNLLANLAQLGVTKQPVTVRTT
ncbi:hypothetical protein [Deinococcus xianganensis]|uniref:Uncharacterized protein n=1 Tax=Deinococcus xianganensis TaxID=1507289 RepID=A0A6I4YFL1_9DEIO|nr:hypothetical protein [Deinococcus xianganensis]MXV18604.1 hypothetical protein [Deinococcus xianganensis]